MVAISRFHPEVRVVMSHVVVGRSTFRDRMCADLGCTPGAFASEVFRRTAKRPARLCRSVVRRRSQEWFATDWSLIEKVGDATTTEHVWSALDDYWSDQANCTPVRRFLGLRISTRKLNWLASRYVPSGAARRGAATFWNR
jgi:hypothetical protein